MSMHKGRLPSGQTFILVASIALTAWSAPVLAGGDDSLSASPRTTARASRPAWPGDEGPLQRPDGRRLHGRLTFLDLASGIAEVRTRDGTELRLDQARGLTLFAEGGDPLPEPHPVRVELSDAQSFVGLPIDRTQSHVSLLSEGTVIELSSVQVVSITAMLRLPEQIDPAHRDAGRGRLLAMPTGLLGAAGEASIPLLEGLQPAMAVGVTSWLQLSARTVIDAGYAEGAGTNASAALTAGFSPLEALRLAGGLQWSGDQSGSIWSLFAAASAGTRLTHVSVYAGPPPLGTYSLGLSGDLVFGLGGRVSLWPHLALVSENWIAGEAAGHRVFDGLALRLFGTSFSVDAGCVVSWLPGGASSTSPARFAPWVGISLADFPANWFADWF